MYFNYHAKLKKLLNTEPYVCIEESGKYSYRFIFPRVMIDMPIRSYRNKEYLEYIRKGGIEI